MRISYSIELLFTGEQDSSVIWRARQYFAPASRIQLHKAQIWPHVEYSSHLTGRAEELFGRQRRLETLQLYARSIVFCHGEWYSPYRLTPRNFGEKLRRNCFLPNLKARNLSHASFSELLGVCQYTPVLNGFSTCLRFGLLLGVDFRNRSSCNSLRFHPH